MNWKTLLILPLAAVALGRPLAVPSRNPEIPRKLSGCKAYDEARALYLRAWAYALESPEVSRKLLAAAGLALGACESAVAGALTTRIVELREKLSL